MKYNLIQSLNISGKVFVVRTDINVPIKDGIVQDNTRIVESYKTVKFLLGNGAKQVVVVSHFGRPKGKIVPEMSLKHILPNIEKIYGLEIPLFTLDEINKISQTQAKVALLENIRFYDGEEKNDENLAKTLSSIGDYYINDAFSASHRAHASISGIAKFTKVFAGLLLQDEITNIETILHNTKKECICTIVGGSKVSTKLELLQNLIHKSQYIILGGGMANTFLRSQGHEIGKSIEEVNFLQSCKEILENAKKCGTQIILPEFIITAKEFKENAAIQVKNIKNIEEDDIVVDVCLHDEVEKCMKKVDFCVWNGPLGAFETQPFKCGTEIVARIIAKHTQLGNVKSIIGGGDVVSAISSSGLKNSMTYISTGGGAFLEWLEGKTLPGIDVCKQ